MSDLLSQPQPNDFDDQSKRGLTLTPRSLALLIFLNLAFLLFIGWRSGLLPGISQSQPTPTTPPTRTPAPTPLPTATPTVPQALTITATPILQRPASLPGIIVLSLSEAGYFHLFAYHPEKLPLTRLTFGNWDDVDPALSPDGTKIAFASHRQSQWDIYVLDLYSGLTTQVTDDLAYDGHPSWSPGSDFLAYEKYVVENLDIYIAPIDGSITPLRVTSHSAPDFQPAWGPQDSLIAFTSLRDGDQDIWIADIDFIGDPTKITNYTFNTTLDQYRPAWSPQGDKLAWVAVFEGYETIFVSDYARGAARAQNAGPGSYFSWDPTGQYLLTALRTPDQHFLAAFNPGAKTYLLPPFALGGRLQGVSWNTDTFPPKLPASILTQVYVTPQAPWEEALAPSAGALYGRPDMLALNDVNAPHPALKPLAVQPFISLRDRLTLEAGWDVLADLENVFIPITQPQPPGLSENWLYTGRAFALKATLIDIEWLHVVRQDFGPQTYWRVYIKTALQDGSQGQPILQYPWDFDARFSGNTTYYEQGGSPASQLPNGYWIDFTALAAEYGWERFPALSNWRSYYQGARFNAFAITSGLDWRDAMLQVWPPEIFITPPAPTVTP